MTQQQLIELVTIRFPDISEGIAREYLNGAQDEFAEKTSILRDELTETPANTAAGITLGETTIEIKKVWLDDKPIQHLSRASDGEKAWVVEGGKNFRAGIYRESSNSFDSFSGTEVRARRIVRPTPFTDSNLDAGCDLPSRFHEALVMRVLEKLSIQRPESDPIVGREYFSRWQDAVREGKKLANIRKDGHRPRIRAYHF